MSERIGEYPVIVGGAPVPGERTFTVLDPSCGSPVGTAPECTQAQLDAAMAAASVAQPGWAANPGARSKALGAAADALEGAAEELVPLLTREQGKPLADARIELAGAVARLRFASALGGGDEVLQDDEVAKAMLVRRPVGVVAAIVPWNAPVIIAMAKVAPALAAGNAVVLKPSPLAPLTLLRAVAILQPALPAGVLNIVSGGGAALGQALVTHPTPRMIDFTGSTETGKLVAAAAAAGLKRVNLELGGNDAAIVLDDADPATIAAQLFWCAFANCGQVCVAIKRLYVPARRKAEFVDALVAEAEKVVVGPGLEPAVTMGPLNNPGQRAHVARMVDEAREGGAQVAFGGRALDRPGNFYEPTIVAAAREGMSLVDDEQFGPALPVLEYDDVDDAVRQANATPFGLGGSVWGTDLERAAAAADRLDCGTAWINGHRVLSPHLPFAGVKASGYGGNAGTEGFLGFTEPRVVWSKKPGVTTARSS